MYTNCGTADVLLNVGHMILEMKILLFILVSFTAHTIFHKRNKIGIVLHTFYPSIVRLVWVISPRNGENKKADSTQSIHAHNALNGAQLDYHALLENFNW